MFKRIKVNLPRSEMSTTFSYTDNPITLKRSLGTNQRPSLEKKTLKKKSQFHLKPIINEIQKQSKKFKFEVEIELLSYDHLSQISSKDIRLDLFVSKKNRKTNKKLLDEQKSQSEKWIPFELDFDDPNFELNSKPFGKYSTKSDDSLFKLLKESIHNSAQSYILPDWFYYGAKNDHFVCDLKDSPEFVQIVFIPSSKMLPQIQSLLKELLFNPNKNIIKAKIKESKKKNYNRSPNGEMDGIEKVRINMSKNHSIRDSMISFCKSNKDKKHVIDFLLYDLIINVFLPNETSQSILSNVLLDLDLFKHNKFLIKSADKIEIEIDLFDEENTQMDIFNIAFLTSQKNDTKYSKIRNVIKKVFKSTIDYIQGLKKTKLKNLLKFTNRMLKLLGNENTILKVVIEDILQISITFSIKDVFELLLFLLLLPKSNTQLLSKFKEKFISILQKFNN